MKTRKWSKIPNQSEIEKFNGLHCSALYVEAVRTGWRCPCCDRTAQELIRWSEIRGPFFRRIYADEFGLGWTISLTRHHCHTNDPTLSRFAETVICGDCNSADGAAKRKLGLPTDFSFSPSEIKQFVRCAPHSGRTEIDFDVARRLFQLMLNGNSYPAT